CSGAGRRSLPIPRRKSRLRWRPSITAAPAGTSGRSWCPSSEPEGPSLADRTLIEQVMWRKRAERMIHRRDFIRRSVLGFGGLSLAGPRRTAPPAAPRFLRQWGSKGSEPTEFHFPIGIAINAADEVFVTDFYNERVQKFNADGKLLAALEVP